MAIDEKVEDEAIRSFRGVIRDITETTVHLRMVDLFDNESYDVTYDRTSEKPELDFESVGLGDKVTLTVYEGKSGEPHLSMEIIPREPLTEEEYKRLDEMFP